MTRPGLVLRGAAMLALSVLLAAPPTTATAQVLPSAPPAETTEPKPETIPAQQIPQRAAATRAQLEALRATLPAGAAVADGRYSRVAAGIARLRQQVDFQRLDQAPAFRIAPLERQVRFYQHELGSLEERDIARATRLSTQAAELSRLRGIWSRTLDLIAGEEVARPLVIEVRQVLGLIDETERLLDRPLAAALAAQQRNGELESQLEAMAKSLAQARDRLEGQLLARDVPPVWSSQALSATAGQDLEAVRARLEDQAAYSRDFIASRRSAVEGFAVIVLALFALVAWMQRGPGVSTPGETALADASRILKRPFSSLALVVLVAVLLGAEYMPSLVQELIAIAIMGLLLRLMPARLVADQRVVLYGIAALFILDRARTLMPYDSLAFRLDLFIVALGLAAGFLRLAVLRRRGALAPQSWVELASRLSSVMLSLLGMGIVAAALGNVTLADLLVRGTLASTYVSVVMFAAALILSDFIGLFVRTGVGRSLRMVEMGSARILRTSRRLIFATALFAWAYVTLVMFRLWEPIATRVSAALGRAWQFGELTVSLGGFLTFVVGVLVAVYTARGIRFVLKEEVLVRLPWPTGAKSTTATLVYYGVLFAGLLLAFSAAGVETGQFALVIGALGVGIGFGLQTVVNNFVSGLILMFERPVQPGDIIDVDTLQGRVMEIGLRATRVRTWEGAEVVVPNGTLLAGNLVNWTLSDSSRRVDVTVGVAYGTNVRRVLELLAHIAAAQPAAMKEPAPVVLFTGFGESSLDFVMRFWTRNADAAAIARSDAGVAVAEAFEAEGIEIPFPQRDVHIHNV